VCVAMGLAACAPWRTPPAAVLDHAPTRVAGDEARLVDDLEESPDLLEHFARPDRATTSLEIERSVATPRVVHRGGQEVWIGEPDRVRQNWIDEHGYVDTSCPLVVAFDDDPVELGPVAAPAFDLGGDTVCDDPDWPTAATPWLVLDRDGNGSIDDGAELFGTATRIEGGGLAADGFAALATLDADADGRITPADPAWTDLRLWSDEDRDRRSQPHELSPLSDRGIVALDLSGQTSPRCDARGNCEAERAPMIYRAADGGRTRRGALVDVHVRCW
jgi:hypothetical protein